MMLASGFVDGQLIVVVICCAIAGILLGVVYRQNKAKAASFRDCPVCGMPVERGKTECASCGHDFKAAATHA